MQLFGFLMVANVILNFGSCDTECWFKRVGPNCQFNNIAYKKDSRHDSNISPPKYSSLATDNNLTTCSYTSNKNHAAPWWNLWLPENTTFKKFEFLTLKSHLSNFINFKVTVHNTTWPSFDKKLLEDTGITCYQYNNYSPQNTKIQVTCDGSPVGNLIRLQLNSSTDELVLCDFRLYEDCKDGFYGNGCEKCSDNCYPSEYRQCDLNDGRCLYGCNSGWKGDRCETNCESGTWGRDCQHVCGECDISDCDIISGFCKRGCSAGFKLPNCTTECDSGYYGKNCSSSCSTKCDNSKRNPVCNKKDGTCTDGCKAGYKGSHCDKGCENGKWGKNCKNECGKCDNSTCDHVNGVCKHGCAPGFKEQKCDRECDYGYFGKNCQKRCNNNCLSSRANALCDKVNGTCLNGCKAGYQGSQCSIKCDAGKWGINCTKDCGKCFTPPCYHVKGYCQDECAAGYKKTLDCHTECDNGTFGKECKSRCNDNCVSVCDKKTGMCSDCKPGWKGDICNDKCDDGTFGPRCASYCSQNCAHICDKTTGMCSDCKSGWKGESCNEKCKDGTYGNSCLSNCSDNCKGICNRINGTCDQCRQFWTGHFCEKVSDKILSDREALTRCQETLKPNIVLICVGILCVILAVYATVITVLFKRKTTQNEKDGTGGSFSGRTHGDSNVNKTNKAETVTYEPATEATTEPARVNITAIDDESHQYTDLSSDIKDVEATYETIHLE